MSLDARQTAPIRLERVIDALGHSQRSGNDQYVMEIACIICDWKDGKISSEDAARRIQAIR